MKLLTKAPLFFLTVLIFHLANVFIVFPEETAVLLINEVMSSNQTTIQDEDGDYPDWIEIYNPGSSAVDFTGYGLSDRSDNPFKWVFPGVTLEPGNHMLIFASGKDRKDTGAPYLHTNFKVNAEGETLVITDSAGTVCDSLFTGLISVDISLGRQTDGASEWVYFSEPTPGESNTGGSPGYADSVVASLTGGFYSTAISLELSVESQTAEIRYTLDGSDPTDSSTVYSSVIQIDSTTVVRTRAYDEGFLPGRINTQTYFINEEQNLAVISLSTHPDNFFDWDTGIYVKGPIALSSVPYWGANFWRDWEMPVHVEFYEPDGSQGFSIDAGAKIGGGWSRRYPRKTLNIYARGRYGYDKIEYQIFPDLPYTKYDSFALRNSGNDWGSSIFRDAFMGSLIKDTAQDLKAYRPAVVYINGAYWGIHGIRERMNEDYMARHYGVDPDNLDIMEIEYRFGSSEVVRSGTDEHYRALEDYLATHDMSDSTNYKYVKTQMDVNNFINYLVSTAYFANYDWGLNNIKWWRPRTPEGRWRWLAYDFDRGFSLKRDEDYGHHTIATVLGTSLYYDSFSNLIQNQSYKYDFINRMADYLNTIFRTDVVIQRLHEMRDGLFPEMPRHVDRWNDEYLEDGKPYYIASMDEWYHNLDVMETFAVKRPAIVRSHLMEYFSLSDTVAVDLDISHLNAGKIKINTLVIGEFPWNGTYFKGIPIQLTAVPNPGYRFIGWSGITSDDSVSVTVDMVGNVSVTANFEIDGSAEETIVINEINYNSLNEVNPGDWVEIYNNHSSPVDISNWVFKDSNDTNEFVIPANTVLGIGEYLVLCENVIQFHEVFPTVDNYIGDLGFNLSNAGELIRLYNSEGSIVDSLTYYDVDPWQVEPDGTGCSLALRDANLDNSLPENWTYSNNYGTPGAVNDWMSGVDEIEVPIVFSLGQNYPNPFNPVTNIPFSIPEPSRVTIEVYSILGQRVTTIVDEYMNAGHHSIVFKADDLSSGIYLYTIKAGRFTETNQMMYMK